MNTSNMNDLLKLTAFQKEILIEEIDKHIYTLFGMCSCFAVRDSLENVLCDNIDKIEAFEELYRTVTGARNRGPGFLDIEKGEWVKKSQTEKRTIRAEALKKFADYIEENF